MRDSLHVVRPSQQPAPRQAPPADRPRTAAGAPADRPRQIPKTGAAERLRDAMAGGFNKETARWYRARPAALQEFINSERRKHGDEMRHAQEADEVEFWMHRRDMIRGGPHAPGVVEAVRRASKAHREQEAPAGDKGPIVEHGPRQRSPEREEAHRIALEKLRQSKEALDEQP